MARTRTRTPTSTRRCWGWLGAFTVAVTGTAVALGDPAPDPPPLRADDTGPGPSGATAAPQVSSLSSPDGVRVVVPDRVDPVLSTMTTTTTAPLPPVQPSVPAPIVSAAAVPPVPAPPPEPTAPPAALDPCTRAALEAQVAALLAPHAIPPPVVEIGNASFYTPGGAVTVVPCARLDVVAHEVGHYVMQRANGDFAAHAADAAANFCPGGAGADGRCVSGWIRGAETYPGIEHAAHCVGNVLAGYGPYTKCPDPSLYALALDRVRAAA